MNALLNLLGFGGLMAPQFIEAGEKNPSQTARMSLLGSMGQNLTPIRQPAKKTIPLGTRSTLNGREVFWTGDKYQWQTGPSALKAGLLGSEVVGDPGFERATRQALPAPAAPVLPPAPTQSRPPAPRTTGPAVPGTSAGNVAAVAPQPMTTGGQYQRYFVGTEMDRYFGGRPGAQMPKDAAAMQEVAMLQQAPTTMGLSDYYRAQSATGRANMDQIVKQMGYTGDMEKWARANPMIAQREYAKQFQGGVPTLGAPTAAPQVDPALNPQAAGYAGPTGAGERLYNFAAEEVTPEKIKAFQALLNKSKVQ